jgi:ribosome-associated protein
MELRKLQRLVVDALEDVKGQDIQVYDTTSLSDLFDRVIVVSGTSNRQTRALAMHLRDQAKAAGLEHVRIEGEDTGEWVLVDLGDIVVHVMQPAVREYYHLEDLWGGKKVRVRLGAPAPAVATSSTSSKPRARRATESARP